MELTELIAQAPWREAVAYRDFLIEDGDDGRRNAEIAGIYGVAFGTLCNGLA